MKKLIIKSALLITFFFNCSVIAFASSGEFTVYPSYTHHGNKSWIVREVHPDETVAESVTLENISDEVQFLSVFFREAEPRDAHFLIYENTDFKNIGQWVSLPESQYRLEPGEKIKIPFKITVPPGTLDGKYYGAVFAAKESPAQNGVKIMTRIGVRVYLDVQAGEYGLASILNSGAAGNAIFLLISAAGLAASVFYNIIIHKENKKNAKKQS